MSRKIEAEKITHLKETNKEEVICRNPSANKKLFAGTLSAFKKLFAGTLPANKKLFDGTPIALFLPLFTVC